MSTLSRITLASLALFLGFTKLQAQPPLFCLGPCTTFHINSAIEERFESNIFRDPENERDDYATILSPGAYIQSGNDSSINKTTLFFREDFYFYSKNSKLDHEQANFFFNSQFSLSRSCLNFDASYIERYDNTPDVNVLSQLIRSRETRSSIHYNYQISPRTAAEFGFDFTNVTYRNKNLTLCDRYVYSIPFSFLYCATPKLEIGPTYKFSYFNLSNQPDFYDHFLGLTLRGEISPKLCAHINIGAATREIQKTDESTTFSADMRFEWEPTCKISTYLKFRRLYDASAFGPSLLNTGVDSGISCTPMCNTTFHLDFIYNNANYRSVTTREDDTFEVHTKIAYTFCRYYRLSVGYDYQDNRSDNAGSQYKNHIAFARLAFKY